MGFLTWASDIGIFLAVLVLVFVRGSSPRPWNISRPDGASLGSRHIEDLWYVRKAPARDGLSNVTPPAEP